MRSDHLSLAVILMVGSFATPTWAILVFDNGPPDTAGFSISDSDFSGPAPFGQSADGFTLPSPETIAQIQWWGVYFPGNVLSVDDFTIRIFPFVGATPAINPLISFDTTGVQRVDSGLGTSNSDIYVYSLDGLNAPLPSGQYLLSVVNNTTLNPTSDWHWATSADLSGSAWVRPTDGSAWFVASNELAFNIRFNIRAIPEPITATLGLMSLGVLGLATRRRAGLGGDEEGGRRARRGDSYRQFTQSRHDVHHHAALHQ